MRLSALFGFWGVSTIAAIFLQKQQMGSKRGAGRTVTRNSEQVACQFREQLLALLDLCEMFDAGKIHMAKLMATSLVTLLFTNSRNKTTSLIDQIGLSSLQMFSWGQPVAPGSKLPQCSIATVVLNGDGVGHLAPCGTGNVSETSRYQLSEWLNQPIARDAKGNLFTRLSLLREVRDTDNGAHSDTDIDVTYQNFTVGEFLGVKIVRNSTQETTVVTSPNVACIRTIAHEFLHSIYAWDFRLLPRPYQEPKDALEKDYCMALQLGPLIAPGLILERDDWSFSISFSVESPCADFQIVISAA